MFSKNFNRWVIFWVVGCLVFTGGLFSPIPRNAKADPVTFRVYLHDGGGNEITPIDGVRVWLYLYGIENGEETLLWQGDMNYSQTANWHRTFDPEPEWIYWKITLIFDRAWIGVDPPTQTPIIPSPETYLDWRVELL